MAMHGRARPTLGAAMTSPSATKQARSSSNSRMAEEIPVGAAGGLARVRRGWHKPAMPSQRQTILVVEDEASIAETVVYALQTEGFAVLWKTTGGEALAALQAQPVALVVLDIGLPDRSGFDVCRELRQQSAVPVIFLTARSDEVDRIVGLELGADDYVAKP